MERLYFASFESPYGRLWAMRNPEGLVQLILPAARRRKLDPGLSMLVSWRDRYLPGYQMMESKRQFDDLTRWLRQYFRGDEPEEHIPLDLQGTPFQKAVWNAILQVPYGHTITYGSISRKLRKKSNAARAVGAAVGSNPVPLVVPCHRVIGVNDKLVGFGGGLKMKQDLLRLEGALLL